MVALDHHPVSLQATTARYTEAWLGDMTPGVEFQHLDVCINPLFLPSLPRMLTQGCASFACQATDISQKGPTTKHVGPQTCRPETCWPDVVHKHVGHTLVLQSVSNLRTDITAETETSESTTAGEIGAGEQMAALL